MVDEPAPHPLDGWRAPRRLLAALALRRGQRVAEVGAGGGYLTPWLAAAVGPEGRVVATDVDAGALAALRARVAALSQVEARQVRGDDAGLEPAGYDLILLAQVDHLLPPRALAALLPALRPGGRLALCNAEGHRDAARRAAQALPGVIVQEPAQDLPAQFLLLIERAAEPPALSEARTAVREADGCPGCGRPAQ